MRKALIIGFREYLQYLVSPGTYLIFSGYIFLAGLFYALLIFNTNSANLREFLYHCFVVLLFFIPLITMRLICEEKEKGTLDSLLSAPLREWEMLLGKYLGGLLLILTIIIATLPFIFITNHFTTIDLKSSIIGYFGLFLLGVAFTSVGLFFSTMINSQIGSAFMTFVFVVFLLFLDYLADIVPVSLKGVFKRASIFYHFDDFTKGILDLEHIIYLLFIGAIFFYLSFIGLKNKRF